MRFLIPVLLATAATAALAGGLDVVLVPKDLQKKFAHDAEQAHKSAVAMEAYCTKLGREIAQNQRTGEFGCILLPPPERDPSQDHAEKF